MTHTSTEQPSLAAIIRDLRESHARTSPGAWGKGATTHETVSRAEGLAPYKVAEFRHANDAQFCDLAHVFVPRLLSEIEALQSRVNELEAQLSATHPTQQGLDAADTIRLNWLDAQVKNHAVHNGFLWQEGGWESDRGLVCAIQGKKQKKTVRQAIDAAIAAQAKQGGPLQ